MNITVLNKEIRIENELVIIEENIETKLDKQQIEHKIRNIEAQKIRLKEQNTRIVEEYNKLIEEESELQGLLEQLSNDGDLVVIEGE